MKTISKLKSVLVLMVFAAAIFSCSDSVQLSIRWFTW